MALLDVLESPNLEKPVLVPNDLAQKPGEPGASDFAGYAMIWGDLGLGRVVVIAGSDWATDAGLEGGGAAKDQGLRSDNRLILEALVGWASRMPVGEAR
jgi:hypothetical protein